MSTPLLATGRMKIPYTATGQNHVMHCYVRGLTLVGSDWMINSRTLDANDTLWTDALERMAVAFEQITSSAVDGGIAELQKLEDGVWITVDTQPFTLADQIGTMVAASQYTLTLRDRNNKHVKVVVMEHTVGTPTHSIAITGPGTQGGLFNAMFGASAANAADPYNWLVGRGNQFLATNPFIAATTTFNRKLRRARGFA